MDKPQKLPRQTPDGRTANIEALRQLLPECFTEVRDNRSGHTRQAIDWDKLRLALADDTADSQDEMYQFNWPGKSDARREAAKPTDETLRPMPEEGESKDWDNTQNVYIEGDNLQVLKLLQQGYMGRVKMIYIDPPYNTGNDFVYHDDFRRTAEEEDLAAGNIDEEGNRFRKNTNTNGRFHSDWCSMIYARLLACRSLLTEDGVIFISIDDNEVANLKKICDEVFGAINYVALITLQSNPRGSQSSKHISSVHEYIMVYAKNESSLILKGISKSDSMEAEYSETDTNGRKYRLLGLRQRGGAWRKEQRPLLHYPIYVNPIDNSVSLEPSNIYNIKVIPQRPTGELGRWTWGKEKINANRNLVVGRRINRSGQTEAWDVFRIDYIDNEDGSEKTAKLKTMWNEKDINYQNAKNEIKALFGNSEIFDYPKPTYIVNVLATNLAPDSLILDFFSGSATTAHAVMQLNAEDGGHRRYICVQLPEETAADSEARKAGYENICEIGKERIRRAGAKIKADSPLTTQGLDTGFRVFRLAESNFENVSLQPKDYEQGQLDLFADNIRPDRTDLDLLFGAMLTMGVPEPLSQPVETVVADGKRIYDVAGGALVACFAEGVTDATVAAIAARRPLRVLFRDSQFQTDAQKINIFEQFKQAMDWTDAEAVKNIKVL